MVSHHGTAPVTNTLALRQGVHVPVARGLPGDASHSDGLSAGAWDHCGRIPGSRAGARDGGGPRTAIPATFRAGQTDAASIVVRARRSAAG
jgi:hypothetical protein